MTNTYEIKYNLIIESCKLDPDSKKIEHFMTQIDDWQSVLNISYVHGVLPLVYKTLKQQEYFPQEALRAFKMQNMQIAQTNMQMTAELVKIVKLFDENNIKYMAIKGPVLSQLIHGNTVERQYTDLDVLVEKEDVLKANEVMKNCGYTPEYDESFLNNSLYLDRAKDLSYTNEINNVLVELHWRIFSEENKRDGKLDLFNENNLNIKINNYRIKTLSIEHMLVYLTLHGSKHFWERIEWTVDIDRMINNDIDWNYIQKVVKDMKCEVMFYLGVNLSYYLLKTQIPKEIERAINNNPNIEKLTQYILGSHILEIDHTHSNKLSIIKKVHNLSLLYDTKWQVIQYYINMLMKVKAIDIYIINLPKPFYHCYHLVRYYRLIKNILNVK